MHVSYTGVDEAGVRTPSAVHKAEKPLVREITGPQGLSCSDTDG
jgi:hypothetical protein